MKLTSEEIFYINALNSVSGADARDCLIQGNFVSFLVEQKHLGKAIGKNGENIKKLRKRISKNVEILERCNEAGEFIRKALYNIKVKKIESIEKDGKKIVFILLDSENKRLLLNAIGRLKRMKEIAKRNYGIGEIKIR